MEADLHAIVCILIVPPIDTWSSILTPLCLIRFGPVNLCQTPISKYVRHRRRESSEPPADLPLAL